LFGSKLKDFTTTACVNSLLSYFLRMPHLNYNAGVYLTLVVCCLALNAGGAAYLIARTNLERQRKALFALAAVVSIALKIILASRWSDYDVGSYEVVASLVLHGKSVYANTERYNYAPLWSLLLTGLKQLSAWLPQLGRHTFHMTVAGFLALVDVALAALMASKYQYDAGIFLLCCPVTIILTGSYSQFDNFALLAGLVAWLLIRQGNASWSRTLSAGAMLGLSLAIKHVCFLFPLWLIFWQGLGNLWKRIACAATACALFSASFLPYATDAPTRAGILQHVFLYRSRFYYSILHLLAGSRHFWLVSAGETRTLTMIWMALLTVAGIMAARCKSDLFGMYLLAMVACSPALNDYYLALPVLACAIFFPRWPIWSFLGAAMVVLFSSPGGIFDLPFSRVYYLSMLTCQVAAGALFIVQFRGGVAADSKPVPAISARRALTLALSAYALLFVILIIKARSFGMTASAWILPAEQW
jgi:hypothetical protein